MLWTVIMHIGINDLLSGGSIESIIWNLKKNIVDLGQKCISYGVDRICISGLIDTARVSYISLRKVNSKLRSICEENGFCSFCTLESKY